MYANLPSVEATTSWGSGPEGIRAITFRLEGSTIASVWSLLESTSNAFGGVPSARTTAEARSPPARSTRPNLMLMTVNYTLWRLWGQCHGMDGTAQPAPPS